MVQDSQTKFENTMTGLRDVVNTETGGNSFCYLEIAPVMPEKNAVNHSAFIGVMRVGKYPLRGITVLINDQDRYSQIANTIAAGFKGRVPTSDEAFSMMQRASEGSTTRLSISDFATSGKSIGGYNLSGQDKESFAVFFSAFNGSWLERLELRRIGPDRWVKAMWVEGPANPYYVRIDKDYPRKANGEPDVPWPRLAKTGAPAWEKPRR